MNTKLITIYDFNELSDSAKMRVQQWILSNGYAWSDESIGTHYGTATLNSIERK